MKNIYNAPNKEVAAAELDNLERKWGGKYPYALLSWMNNWDDLTVFFQFPLEIRKIIYTTILIENLNGKSESTQNQSFHFLLMMQSKRPFIFHLWRLRRNGYRIHNWGLIMNQFMLMFEK